MKVSHLKQTDFSLVLSGGGALGYAHLGVLADLEKYNLIPKEIIGTSMGGIIGACLALGMKEQQIHSQIKTFSSALKWIRIALSGNAIIDTKKIKEIFETIFENKKIGDTLIPLKIITTNLLTGAKKTFCAQDNVLIADALLATIAVPGIFKEHTINGQVYGDGFLCENLGISEATFDNIIAVNLFGKKSLLPNMPNHFFKVANVLSMFERSMRLLMYHQANMLIQNSNKNIYLIEPETYRFKTYHFHKVDEIRKAGLNLLS